MSVEDPPAAPPPGPRARHYRDNPNPSTADWVRFGLRGTGQTLITAGLVVLLFVVYELWVTNIFAHEKQAKAHSQLEKEWARGKDPLGSDNPRLTLPGGKQST